MGINTVQRVSSGAVIALDGVPRDWAWRRGWACRNQFSYTETQEDAFFRRMCEGAVYDSRSVWLYE